MKIDDMFDDDSFTYVDGEDPIGFDELPTEVIRVTAQERTSASNRLAAFGAAMEERDPTQHWTERVARQLDVGHPDEDDGYEPVDLVDAFENGIFDLV